MNINEVLTDYKTIGDFDKTASFGGYRGADIDRKLAVHPTNIKKAFNFFGKTDHNFKFYVINAKELKDKGERGITDTGWIRENFPNDPLVDEICEVNRDVISVCFLDNSGSQRVMFTPWIMAHRISHALARTDDNLKHYDAFISHMLNAIGAGYKIQALTGKIRYNNSHESVLCSFFNAIGKQKSSREGKISRPFEFVHECFAKYLTYENPHDDFEFNDPPEIITYNRNKLYLRDEIYCKEFMDRAKYDIMSDFDSMLGSSYGKVLIM